MNQHDSILTECTYLLKDCFIGQGINLNQILLVCGILANIVLIYFTFKAIQATKASSIATKESTKTSQMIQDELRRQRFAKYDTIIRYNVQAAYPNGKFNTKTDIFEHFLTLAVIRKDKNYMSRIIAENSITDSNEFLEYLCKAADQDILQYMFLIQ